MATGSIDAPFPAALQCLFEPKRYKVLWGGRGAGRSWGVARALILLGTTKAIRVLCVRELQNSIAESVHKVLSDQIEALGLSNFYEIQVAKIIGKNGTSFSFDGIKNNTNKIKSYEGIDYCWVEEANKVSKASWGIIIPTVRKNGSEIWITFNPELDTDYTYTRFVKAPDLKLAPADRFSEPTNCKIYESPRAFVVKMTYKNNDWFPQELQEEMEEDRKRDEDYYLNVWEGHCVQVLEGAVYAKELRRAQEEGRICQVPWDREAPVDTFWDLGRADNTAIWFAQRVAMQFRVLAYFEDSGEDITYFVKELQRRSYVYGEHWLPHDGKAKQLGSKRTVQETLGRAYPGHVHIVPKYSKLDGINAARLIFPNCWFDEEETADGLTALRHYRYRVIDGQFSNEPLHDAASDGADAFRCMAMALKTPKAQSGTIGKLKKSLNKWAEKAPGLGWMG